MISHKHVAPIGSLPSLLATASFFGLMGCATEPPAPKLSPLAIIEEEHTPQYVPIFSSHDIEHFFSNAIEFEQQILPALVRADPRMRFLSIDMQTLFVNGGAIKLTLADKTDPAQFVTVVANKETAPSLRGTLLQFYLDTRLRINLPLRDFVNTVHLPDLNKAERAAWIGLHLSPDDLERAKAVALRLFQENDRGVGKESDVAHLLAAINSSNSEEFEALLSIIIKIQSGREKGLQLTLDSKERDGKKNSLLITTETFSKHLPILIQALYQQRLNGNRELLLLEKRFQDGALNGAERSVLKAVRANPHDPTRCYTDAIEDFRRQLKTQAPMPIR